MSDTEHRPKATKDRRKSMDHDDRAADGGSAGPSRSSSIKGFGLKGKPSFSFGKKKKEDVSRPGSSSSGNVSSPVTSGAGTDSERGSIAESLSSAATTTTATTTTGVTPSSPVVGGWKHHHGPGPTPAQAAYIQRILANQGPPEPMDPLAKLRAANNGEGLAVNNANGNSAVGEYGLVDCLKQFTSVEVLEGENSFACKKCWRIQSGKYAGMEPSLKEEDEDVDDHGGLLNSPLLPQRRATAPAISIISDSSSDITSTSASVENDDRPSIRHPSVTSNRSGNIRAPSPLRRQFPDSSAASIPPSEDAISLSSSRNEVEVESAPTGEEEDEAGTDGLSDTSEDSDVPIPQQSELPVGRPKMAPRKKSTHFVHRRAFKRYLIAKAPEVLVLHMKRFRQTKTSMPFTSFYDLKK